MLLSKFCALKFSEFDPLAVQVYVQEHLVEWIECFYTDLSNAADIMFLVGFIILK